MQVPIAIWVISHPELRTDRLHATTDISHVMLCIAGGFFLHDAICCLMRESPFYVVHGLTCCLGYVAAATYGSGHFYGGLFLLWEMSTPFVQLRWVLHKMALADTSIYMINNLLMVITFTLVRVVAGSCAIPIPSCFHVFYMFVSMCAVWVSSFVSLRATTNTCFKSANEVVYQSSGLQHYVRYMCVFVPLHISVVEHLAYG